MAIGALSSPLKAVMRATLGQDRYLWLALYVRRRFTGAETPGAAKHSIAKKRHRVVIYYTDASLMSLEDSKYMRGWFDMALLDCRVQIIFGSDPADGENDALRKELSQEATNARACKAFTSEDVRKDPNCCGPTCGRMLELNRASVFVVVPRGCELRNDLIVLAEFVEARYPSMQP